MENIYEVMWKENKQWLENGLVYYSNLLKTYHPEVNRDFNRIEELQGLYQFQLDKLSQDEERYKKKIDEYEEEMNIGK